MKLILNILICAVVLDFGSGSASLHGSFRSGGVVGCLGFRVEVSASYSYFRLSFTENKIIPEKFS